MQHPMWSICLEENSTVTILSQAHLTAHYLRQKVQLGKGFIIMLPWTGTVVFLAFLKITLVDVYVHNYCYDTNLCLPV